MWKYNPLLHSRVMTGRNVNIDFSFRVKSNNYVGEYIILFFEM